jgi:hypothetical protein
MFFNIILKRLQRKDNFFKAKLFCTYFSLSSYLRVKYLCYHINNKCYNTKSQPRNRLLLNTFHPTSTIITQPQHHNQLLYK